MTVGTVSRAARVLRLIAESAQPPRANDVAAAFDLPLPTAYRLLATLADEGLLAKTADRRYELGPVIDLIANSPALRVRVPPGHRRALRILADETGETSFLTAWHRGTVRIDATVEGAHAVRVAGLQVGLASAAHARAGAKLLLAFARDELRDEVLDSCDFQAYTHNTISTRAALEAELTRVRSSRLAHDDEEFRAGVHAVAAPILQGDRAVAALSIAVPAERFRERGNELIAILERVSSRATADA